ncbi:MAG: hypothetical protein JEY91_14775 [Spirochaetaceae bacterium]|nr:hypothetical protein [Spirochaetaceae bacterium]
MKKNLSTALLISLFSIAAVHPQVIKAAVTEEPGSFLIEFYTVLSQRSGVKIQKIPLLPQEIPNALAEGLVDIGLLPDNEKTNKTALIQTPVIGSPFVLISSDDFVINERNIIDLRTIAVFTEDEPFLIREIIDPFSLEPRIQKARHYDSLVKIMSTGRVSAIFIPLDEFERSLRHINEDRNKFGQPFIAGYRELFLVLSKRRADKVAPLMDRLIQTLEEMKNDGTIEELITRP